MERHLLSAFIYLKTFAGERAIGDDALVRLVLSLRSPNDGFRKQGDMQLKRAIAIAQHGLKRSKKGNNISVEPKINVKKFPLTANV
jgi:hypothetical protein